MGSENAKAVAREVLETLRKGKRVNKGEIIRKNGYSESTATVPNNVTDTKSYQEVVRPVVERMIEERDEVIKAMKLKRDDAHYNHLTDALDKLTKNIQLLSGEQTENSKITFGWEE